VEVSIHYRKKRKERKANLERDRKRETSLGCTQHRTVLEKKEKSELECGGVQKERR
jgi:hypothetical protein